MHIEGNRKSRRFWSWLEESNAWFAKWGGAICFFLGSMTVGFFLPASTPLFTQLGYRLLGATGLYTFTLLGAYLVFRLDCRKITARNLARNAQSRSPRPDPARRRLPDVPADRDVVDRDTHGSQETTASAVALGQELDDLLARQEIIARSMNEHLGGHSRPG